ncbi:MAG TPA: hypothetical protein VGH97_15750 [Thermoanaerobaculia bacterium]|jgi:hypothetical protein
MRHGWLRLSLLLAALIALPGLAFAFEEQSLLTPDGSLHTVRAGKAVDLGIAGLTPSPDSFVIDWTSLTQDGTIQTAIIPGTVSYQEKRGLQLTYDENTGKLVLIWIEEISAYSHVRVGVLQNGVWTNSPLMPTQGISRAYNPQVTLMHLPVTWLDDKDKPVSATSSILSVIWWEESTAVEARYATLFLDENATDPGSLDVYEMPNLIGGSTQSSYAADIPPGAYLYPSLQVDGFSGAVLASFADLHDDTEKVVRVAFPTDRGKPSEYGNLKWNRRHAPIVSIQLTGPVARMTPVLANRTDPEIPVGTSIGAGYRPTFYWLDGSALKFSRLDGPDWSPVRSIAIDDTMTYEKARDLVVSMGQGK